MVKAYYSLDVLISSSIILFMLFFILQTLTILSYDSYVIEYNKKMRKLYLASDYFVIYKSKKDYKSFINIDPEIRGEDVEKIKNQLGLDRLEVGYNRGEGDCLVRYVYSGEIKKLYICG